MSGLRDSLEPLFYDFAVSFLLQKIQSNSLLTVTTRFTVSQLASLSTVLTGLEAALEDPFGP